MYYVCLSRYKFFKKVTNKVGKQMYLGLGKLGLMHINQVLSQMSLYILHRLIRDFSFRFNGIFCFKGRLFYTKIQSWRKRVVLD